MNPLEKLEVLSSYMPDTLFQTLCRGVNLFGYRPYPENVIRLTVQSFSRYVHVWRVFDFLNYIPNMVPVFEEVKRAGRILEPSICFSTGKEHTDKYYVGKVGEILDVTGPEIILCIKNHAGLGTAKRIGDLVKPSWPNIPTSSHYHGTTRRKRYRPDCRSSPQTARKIVDARTRLYGFYAAAAFDRC